LPPPLPAKELASLLASAASAAKPSPRIGAVFLATVLIAGTIAASSQWSMILGAQAEPYYGMDKDRNSDRKNVSVSSLKCNNINVNVNGLELDVFPPFLGGDLAAEAAEASSDASSFAGNGGGNGGSEINDFRFICINNNNNTVIEAAEPPVPPTPPVEDACLLCFEEFGFEGFLLGVIADLSVEDILELEAELGLLEGTLAGLGLVETIEDLCEFLEEIGGLELTVLQLGQLIFAIFGIGLFLIPGLLIAVLNLLACLIDNGIIVLIEGDIGDLQGILQTLRTTPGALDLTQPDTTTPDTTTPDTTTPVIPTVPQ
jgi:hypothetical protein